MRRDDLFAPELLEDAFREGWVVRREHPVEPLAILNYTDAATFARAWNPCTLACRGLVYRTDTLEVVARPFRKFFNYGEPSAPPLDLATPAVVSDKLDGSLGILYPTSEGWAVATRGSFESDQAKHATEVWRERYAGYDPPAGWTMLFEIIYPANRIVVDYGAANDLHLLGAVEIATGRSRVASDAWPWPGPRAQVFPHLTLADALSAPPRPNAEGLIVYLPDSGERVKLKQEDYVALHRIVTGLNERTVWEHLKAGLHLDDLIAPLPDEFHDWTRSVGARLASEVLERADAIERSYVEVVATLPEGFTKKDFALAAQRTPHPHALYARRDGKDYFPALWEQIKPPPFLGPRQGVLDLAGGKGE